MFASLRRWSRVADKHMIMNYDVTSTAMTTPFDCRDGLAQQLQGFMLHGHGPREAGEFQLSATSRRE